MNPAADSDARDWKTALKRGSLCRCPRCGNGKIFKSFLSVAPSCDSCGLELSGHRADDMPPYITLMIVGHVIVALILLVERNSEWPMLWHMVLWPVLTLAFTLAIMQPVKGAVIGYQWALKMHGFEPLSAGNIPVKAASP
jgi:uncharacterized protein (DUF983 family)